MTKDEYFEELTHNYLTYVMELSKELYMAVEEEKYEMAARIQKLVENANKNMADSFLLQFPGQDRQALIDNFKGHSKMIFDGVIEFDDEQ